MNNTAIDRIADAVPKNWLHPHLNGKNKIIGNAPYGPIVIEHLLSVIREDVRKVAENEIEKLKA